MSPDLRKIEQFVVTAEQMREIEERIFAAGMPVAALMEKVAGLITQRVVSLYPPSRFPQVGILVGPGHNGGDALVVARELFFRGYKVQVYHPFARAKELTAAHARYVRSLGILFIEDITELQSCNLLIDGLFGFGLERSLTGAIATAIDQINGWDQPVVSIDLPSGLHTDTGAVLGTAIRAEKTFCLGLWKLGLFQDQALEYVGEVELLDFDIPLADIQAILGAQPSMQRITRETAIAALPLHRSPTTHKYKQGHLLLIGGSQRYGGGIVLTGLGARVTGVGMLSIAVPESLKSLLLSYLPEALIIGCPETATGAIAHLPTDLELSQFDTIACGPGLTTETATVVEQVLASDRPLVLDADGLNLLAQLGTVPTLKKRQTTTVLTPHPGEFKRLFPDLSGEVNDRPQAVNLAATQTGAIVLLKGARVAIGSGNGKIWINPDSSPALARGGSGDVLTGLIGGLLTQAVLAQHSPEEAVCTGVWWHAQAGIYGASQNTEMGVDAFTLTQLLLPALQKMRSTN